MRITAAHFTGRPRRAAAVLLGTALIAAACSSDPDPTPLSQGAGFFAHLTSVGGSVCAGDRPEDFLPEDNARLTGPHFDISVLCSTTTTTMPGPLTLGGIDSDQGTDLGALLPAPEGYEYLVTQLDPSWESESQFPADDAELSASLTVGERATPLESFPAAGDVLVAMVPSDAPVRLVVNDSGRDQAINLRDKVRENEVRAYYNAGRQSIFTDVYEGTVESENDTWQTEAEYSTSFELTRSAWLPDEGWAADGRTFITVEFPWPDYTDIQWELDPAGSVTLESEASGELESVTDEQGDGSAGTLLYTVVYDAPVDELVFTLTMHPDGDIVVREDDSTTDFTTEPEDQSYDIDFG